jgi:hypothetical protein
MSQIRHAATAPVIAIHISALLLVVEPM